MADNCKPHIHRFTDQCWLQLDIHSNYGNSYCSTTNDWSSIWSDSYQHSSSWKCKRRSKQNGQYLNQQWRNSDFEKCMNVNYVFVKQSAPRNDTVNETFINLIPKQNYIVTVVTKLQGVESLPSSKNIRTGTCVIFVSNLLMEQQTKRSWNHRRASKGIGFQRDNWHHNS